MEKIKIDVNKQMDGYTFSLSVSTRNKIKSLFPNAFPANTIFVSYDVGSEFNSIENLSPSIIPSLFCLSESEINLSIEIDFVDSNTETILHIYKIN